MPAPFASALFPVAVPERPREPSGHRLHYCGMQWIEALINISAFLGFVGVASLGGKTCDPEEPVA